MKSNEVIIVNEWFGSNPISYQDRLANQLFLKDFKSDLTSSLLNGIQTGIINPPGASSADLNPEFPDGKPPEKKKEGPDVTKHVYYPPGPEGPKDKKDKEGTDNIRDPKEVRPITQVRTATGLRPIPGPTKAELNSLQTRTMRGDIEAAKQLIQDLSTLKTRGYDADYYIQTVAPAMQKTLQQKNPEAYTHFTKIARDMRAEAFKHMGKILEHGGLTWADCGYEVLISESVTSHVILIETILDDQYVKLNNVLESIMFEEGEEFHGIAITLFIEQWMERWLYGIDVTHTKPQLTHIIGEIAAKYESSSNPKKPDIDQTLITKLGQASWAASKAANQDPGKAKGMDNADDASDTDAQDARHSEISHQVGQRNKKAIDQIAEVPIGYVIKDASSMANWKWNGKRWINDASKKEATPGQHKRLTQHALEHPNGSLEALPKSGQKDSRRTISNTVKDAGKGLAKKVKSLSPTSFKGKQDESINESKTNSALRAEKIALLKTR